MPGPAVRRDRPRPRATPSTAAQRARRGALVLALAAGCSEHPFVDAAMESAYRPPGGARLAAALTWGTRYELLAGDLHCHVSPPDHPAHAVRDAAETATLAAREGLDFVVLTPHEPARFFADAGLRADFLARQGALREGLARAAPGPVVMVPGFEYTDHAFGHVSASFADAAAVLAEATADADAADPAGFFRRWVARGGVLVINHPLVVPVPSAVPIARADLSWRAWTVPGAVLPPEILALDRLAVGVEAYNLAAAHLRDRLVFRDEDHTLLATLAATDASILTQQRRITPVGGTDSHSHHLRATTFVLASARTADGVRDALVAGRVCVRGPEACSFRVRAAGGAWQPPGGSVRAADAVEVRVLGADPIVLRNGVVVARPAGGALARVETPPGCGVFRARAGASYSAPVYVNCAFADAPPAD